MRTIKREVIMRESDMVKILTEVIIPNGLYDRVYSEPLTYQGIKYDNLIEIMKNPNTKPLAQRTLPDLYEAMLYKEPNLYNKNYLKWDLTMDFPEGQIYARSRKDQPRDPMVRAYFEKDFA